MSHFKYSFKKWPKKKVKELLIIYPFYNSEKLMQIVDCTENELREFENKFKKVIKWLR